MNILEKLNPSNEYEDSNTYSINRQKAMAHIILRAISDTFKQSDVYLAGGMLRDHYFGKEGKDYDIYIPYDPSFDYDTFMVPMLNGISHFKGFSEMALDEKDSYGYSGNKIISVYEGLYDQNNEPVQIIVTKDNPRFYIEDDFCCSLSKVWQIAHHNPVYTEGFVKSVESKVINFDFSAFSKVNYNYIEKILNKYPEFKADEHTINNYMAKSYWD
jgi:hypothetical protein